VGLGEVGAEVVTVVHGVVGATVLASVMPDRGWIWHVCGHQRTQVGLACFRREHLLLCCGDWDLQHGDIHGSCRRALQR